MYSSQLFTRSAVIPVPDERNLLKCQMLLEHGWSHFSKKENARSYIIK